jgi:recombinase/recombinase-like zinc beta ribbon protein
MTAGLLNKARRGELALTLPVGLIRDATGRVHKDPHQEVQDRLQLIFTTFLQKRSASKVLEFLNRHDLLLPRRDRFGDLVWKRPTVAAILQILKNPAYAGAFVYGRTRTVHTDPASPRAKQIRLPQDEWKIRVPDVYPAYISWHTFEQIQNMLADNYAAYDRNKTRGVPRPGAALLQGMVACGECGHKMVIQYKHGTRYLCNFLESGDTAFSYNRNIHTTHDRWLLLRSQVPGKISEVVCFIDGACGREDEIRRFFKELVCLQIGQHQITNRCSHTFIFLLIFSCDFSGKPSHQSGCNLKGTSSHVVIQPLQQIALKPLMRSQSDFPIPPHRAASPESPSMSQSHQVSNRREE